MKKSIALNSEKQSIENNCWYNLKLVSQSFTDEYI